MKLSTTVIILKKNTYMMLVTNTQINFYMNYSNTLMPMILKTCVYQLEGFNALTKCKEYLSENYGAARLWIQLWNSYGDINEQLWSSAIQAERTGNWQNHFIVAGKILNFFGETGHFQYGKFATLYLKRTDESTTYPLSFIGFVICFNRVITQWEDLVNFG